MYISSAHDGENLKVISAHAFKRHIKTLIRVHVGKIDGIHEVPKMFGVSLPEFSLKYIQVDDPKHTRAFSHYPALKVASPNTVYSIPDVRLSGQRL